MTSEKNTVDRAIEIEDRLVVIEERTLMLRTWLPFWMWTDRTMEQIEQEIDELESEKWDLVREYRG